MKRLMLALIGFSMLSGCSSLPETARTAVIHDINFGEHMVPADLTVQVGDEIRWVNHRSMDILLDIPGLHKDMLACERNFSGRMSGVEEVTTVAPNKSASLCFNKPIVISYNGRMKSAVPGGMVIEPGTIRVVQ